MYIVVLKMEQFGVVMDQKDPDGISNSAGPDQSKECRPRSDSFKQSDLGLHSLLRPVLMLGIFKSW